MKFLSVKIRISSKLFKTKIIHQFNCICQNQMFNKIAICQGFFLLSFPFPRLNQDCLDLSPWFSYKYTLFCSGTLVWRYLDSYVIVGVYGALTINGCV